MFGTLVDVQIDDLPEAKAQQASQAVFARYQQLHQQLHAWQDGELQQLNTAIAQGNTRIPVSPALAGLLQHAQQLSVQSGGLFNPAIGQLIALWGFHREQFSPVNFQPQQLQQLQTQRPTMTDLTISKAAVASRNRSVQIDLGGYAKGYALDEGMAILKAHGVKNALINIGGNVMALGQHHGRAWRVGIQHPRQPGAMAALDLPSGWAIGTSGDYQRYYMKEGMRYCHIIDPRTGRPVQTTQAVTVLIAPQGHAGVLSDVASKPMFIAPEQASQLASTMDVAGWLMVDRAGKISLNPPMQQRLTWLNPETARHAQLVE